MQHAPTTPSNGAPGMMRYPIPPQAPVDGRHATGVRGKKDIKRRTKTGCLTCRKRRIKCDESQPTCRNCTKSKRDCLGYDPIFKQQTSPAPIQPAPASTTATAASSATLPLPPNPYPPAHTYSATVFSLRIDDLFALNDVPPRYETHPARLASLASQQELSDFYTFHYAPGLDRLFETTWYAAHGFAHLQANPELADFVLACAEQFKSSVESSHVANQLRSLEACLVWRLASMPRSANPGIPDLATRVDTLEHLLTGTFLDMTRMPPQPSAEQGRESYEAETFWYNLALFTAARDDRPDQGATQQIDHSLGVMRGILRQKENRDVLYSVAIGRYIGGRTPDFHPQRHLLASTNDSNEDVNKLIVAQQFIEAENQSGTSQVVQRICSMALRGWLLQKQ
ncbi:hypothetical protein BAUCODRAFT_118634 [Baudoinia panamericana UAMH 10762]|uniref:Zn(2)-C6 fungal-type domain-containing protein n=1 Tax=Baudoinia panamericana (strain UAMH 10762) TaxID=717646 RepID=M2NN13_BAUPA|nr:uncharacterized protein BAUCODRAFT_118634 [Baudoinia panamericana UAMH 10762]EMD00910.1 hypothetical protein BAUCODRAFT_118634 [Baudoinia panamericana UAMH 10762]